MLLAPSWNKTPSSRSLEVQCPSERSREVGQLRHYSSDLADMKLPFVESTEISDTSTGYITAEEHSSTPQSTLPELQILHPNNSSTAFTTYSEETVRKLSQQYGHIKNEMKALKETHTNQVSTLTNQIATLKRMHASHISALTSEITELERSRTYMSAVLRKILVFEHNTKIDGSNLATWKDNVCANLDALNAKKSKAEYEVMIEHQMSMMYKEREAKMEARIRQLPDLLLKF